MALVQYARRAARRAGAWRGVGVEAERRGGTHAHTSRLRMTNQCHSDRTGIGVAARWRDSGRGNAPPVCPRRRRAPLSRLGVGGDAGNGSRRVKASPAQHSPAQPCFALTSAARHRAFGPLGPPRVLPALPAAHGPRGFPTTAQLLRGGGWQAAPTGHDPPPFGARSVRRGATRITGRTHRAFRLTGRTAPRCRRSSSLATPPLRTRGLLLEGSPAGGIVWGPGHGRDARASHFPWKI